uniref:STAS domain-containing protein n=1 Tax=Ascaris lumbricoides TaxID=6252 RepID=A0A9J2PKD2_ASCLU
MEDDELKIPIVINREVINQKDFDSKYGYAKPHTDIKQRIFACLPAGGRKNSAEILKRFAPIVDWLSRYEKNDLITDIIAGLTVGVLCVPQAMAYASLANVNAVVGLYTSFFPAITYAIFGTSKHITLGMFAVVALMVGNAVDRELRSNSANETDPFFIGSISDVNPEIVLVSTLAFLVGLLMAIMSVLKLHFITSYLSDPLVGGFTTGAACHVFASQVPKLIGVSLRPRQGLFKLPYLAKDFILSLPNANRLEVLISLISIGILVVGKLLINPSVQRRFHAPIPFELFVMICGIVITHSLQLHEKYGVAIVGDIPRRLPSPSIPRFQLFRALLVDAILIAIVIFSVTVSVGKVFAKKHNYQIIASQELRALALCQLVGGLTSCHPASASLSRAVVNSQMGVRSEVSSCVSAILVLFVILVVGPLLHDLPMSILASIIIVALEKMFLQAKDTQRLWKVSKIDFLIWLVSFFGTFLWNVSEGLGISIGFATLTVIIRTQWANAVTLGQMHDTELYKDVRRYRNAEIASNITIYRYDAPLLFLNNDRFKSRAIRMVDQKFKDYDGEDKKFVIIDASGFTYIDYMGVEGLKDLHAEFTKKDIQMLIASPKAAARELFMKCQLYDIISENLFFPSIHDAFVYAKAHQTKRQSSNHYIESDLLPKKADLYS